MANPPLFVASAVVRVSASGRADVRETGGVSSVDVLLPLGLMLIG